MYADEISTGAAPAVTPAAQAAETISLPAGKLTPNSRKDAIPRTDQLPGINEFGATRKMIPANADFTANEAFLDAQLEELMADLAAMDFYPHTATSPDTTTPKEHRAPDLSADILNDDQYDVGVVPRVHVAVPPPGFQAPAEIQNVDLVPVQPAVDATPVPAETPIARSQWFVNQDLTQLSSMTRGATQSARVEGSLAASVAQVLGVEHLHATTSPILGLACRVAQAILCASTGATASQYSDNPGYDIRFTRLSDFDDARALFPGHVPLWAPESLTLGATGALATLCLPFGAGGFTWRFRDAAGPVLGPDPRAGLMPAAARTRYPGGSMHIMVVRQGATNGINVGGGSLTLDHLWELERWIRDSMDPGLMDVAWRTMMAAGAVFAEPVILPVPPEGFGDGMRPVQVTTEHEGGQQLKQPWNFPPVQQIANRLRLPIVGRLPPMLPAMQNALWNAATAAAALNAAAAGPAADAAAVAAARGAAPTPNGWNAAGNRQCVSIYLDVDNNVARISSQGPRGGDPQRHDWQLAPLVRWMSRPLNGVNPAIYKPLSGYMQTVGSSLGDIDAPTGLDDFPDEPPGGIRNVYGHDDGVTLRLPEFDLLRITPIIIGAHVLLKHTKKHGRTDRRSLERRRARYASRLHLLHNYNCAERDFWPHDMHWITLSHGTLMRKLPPYAQNLCLMARMSTVDYEAPNWQVLESPYLVTGGTRHTAYYGFQVPGTWIVDEGGRASVSGPHTNYPALDAALRDTLDSGRLVHVNERLRSNFAPVLNCHNMHAPLGISPRALGGRTERATDITVSAFGPRLAAGSNQGGLHVVVR